MRDCLFHDCEKWYLRNGKIWSLGLNEEVTFSSLEMLYDCLDGSGVVPQGTVEQALVVNDLLMTYQGDKMNGCVTRKNLCADEVIDSLKQFNFSVKDNGPASLDEHQDRTLFVPVLFDVDEDDCCREYNKFKLTMQESIFSGSHAVNPFEVLHHLDALFQSTDYLIDYWRHGRLIRKLCFDKMNKATVASIVAVWWTAKESQDHKQRNITFYTRHFTKSGTVPIIKMIEGFFADLAIHLLSTDDSMVSEFSTKLEHPSHPLTDLHTHLTGCGSSTFWVDVIMMRYLPMLAQQSEPSRIRAETEAKSKGQQSYRYNEREFKFTENFTTDVVYDKVTLEKAFLGYHPKGPVRVGTEGDDCLHLIEALVTNSQSVLFRDYYKEYTVIIGEQCKTITGLPNEYFVQVLKTNPDHRETKAVYSRLCNCFTMLSRDASAPRLEDLADYRGRFTPQFDPMRYAMKDPILEQRNEVYSILLNHACTRYGQSGVKYVEFSVSIKQVMKYMECFSVTNVWPSSPTAPCKNLIRSLEGERITLTEQRDNAEQELANLATSVRELRDKQQHCETLQDKTDELWEGLFEMEKGLKELEEKGSNLSSEEQVELHDRKVILEQQKSDLGTAVGNIHTAKAQIDELEREKPNLRLMYEKAAIDCKTKKDLIVSVENILSMFSNSNQTELEYRFLVACGRSGAQYLKFLADFGNTIVHRSLSASLQDALRQLSKECAEINTPVALKLRGELENALATVDGHLSALVKHTLEALRAANVHFTDPLIDVATKENVSKAIDSEKTLYTAYLHFLAPARSSWSWSQETRHACAEAYRQAVRLVNQLAEARGLLLLRSTNPMASDPFMPSERRLIVSKLWPLYEHNCSAIIELLHSETIQKLSDFTKRYCDLKEGQLVREYVVGFDNVGDEDGFPTSPFACDRVIEMIREIRKEDPNAKSASTDEFRGFGVRLHGGENVKTGSNVKSENPVFKESFKAHMQILYHEVMTLRKAGIPVRIGHGIGFLYSEKPSLAPSIFDSMRRGLKSYGVPCELNMTSNHHLVSRKFCDPPIAGPDAPSSLKEMLVQQLDVCLSTDDDGIWTCGPCLCGKNHISVAHEFCFSKDCFKIKVGALDQVLKTGWVKRFGYHER